MSTLSLDFDAPDLPTALVLTGLTRTDTDAAVTLPVPPDFTDDGSGTWSIEFAEPAPGLTYAYTATATWDDASTSPFSGTFDDIGTAYAGRYTTETEVRKFIGTLNAEVYGDLDADGSIDAGVMEQSIRTAEGRVDLHTGGPYTFTVDLAGEVAADVFNAWAYKVAAYEIAAKRGFQNLSQDAFVALRDEVLAEMKDFRDGVTVLTGAVGPADNATGDAWQGEEPISVLPTVDQHGRSISDPPPTGVYWDANAGAYRWS
jgi:hypothetical protein